jgi:rhodanese-related sulfurtransferase
MNPLVWSRHWQLMLMSLVLLFAVLTRYGGPLNPAPKVNAVSIPEAVALIESGALVIDVRQSPTAHLPGALLIPLEVLAAHLPKLEAAKAQSIVVYCGYGTTRGPRAAQILADAGFTHVVNLAAGFESWRDARLPVVAG